MIFTSKFLFSKVLKKYDGITLFPFIFLKFGKDEIPPQDYKILLNHEKIHFRQQTETLVIFFYVLYAVFYLRNRLKGMGHFAAYKNIPFEKECYALQNDLSYLDRRKFFAWKNFIL